MNILGNSKSLEKRHFDLVYGKENGSLVISEKEIERYRHPSGIPFQAREFSHFLMGKDLCGKLILDYGCGTGQNAVFMAKRGAKVISVDISERGVCVAKRRAKANNVDIHVVVMDAECMAFKDNVFGGIIGNAILHHLDIKKSICEVKRVLKAGGVAVFREPFISNNVLRIMRKLIPCYPSCPTPSERPLGAKDISYLAENFASIEYWFFEAFSRINYLLKNDFLVNTLLKIDYRFNKLLMPLASCVVLKLIK